MNLEPYSLKPRFIVNEGLPTFVMPPNTRFFWALLLLFTLSVHSNEMKENHELQLFAEYAPPLNYVENGVNKGINVEIAQRLMEKLKQPYQLFIVPWARAYSTVQSKSNTAIVSITRLAKREQLFHWVGPIMGEHLGFYKLSTRTDILVDDVNDLFQFRIGVIRDGSAANFLLNNGLIRGTHFVEFSNQVDCPPVLFKHRLDLVASTNLGVRSELCKQKQQKGHIVLAFDTNIVASNYIAVNKDVDEQFVKRLRMALNEMWKTGEVEKIVKKYLP